MTWLGNVDKIQTEEAGFLTREAIERLARRIEGLERQLASLQRNDVTIINNPPDTILQGTGPLSVPIPFILEPSKDITYGGVDFFPGAAYSIYGGEMACDPYDKPTAETSFSIQNDATSPTSMGNITFAANAGIARTTSLAIAIGASQKVYIKTPATLNGMQNLMRIILYFAPAAALGLKK